MQEVPRACRAFVALAAVAALYVISDTAWANPVPDQVWRLANELPHRVAGRHTARDDSLLDENICSYGLGIFEPKTREFIASHFDALKTHLIRGQEPGCRLDPELQTLFRSKAKAADRRAMCESLCKWILWPLTKAPRQGGMQIVGPMEAVQSQILKSRVLAIQWLGEYGDTAAVRPLRYYLRNLSGMVQRARWDSMTAASAAEASIARIERSAAGGKREAAHAKRLR